MAIITKNAAGLGPKGLFGDVRILAPKQTATLIDAEWPTPRPLLVTAQAINNDTGVNQDVNWVMQTGIQRVLTARQEGSQHYFTRICLARMTQLMIENPTDFTVKVTAVVTPIDVSAGVDSLISPIPESPTSDRANVTQFWTVPVNVASVAIYGVSAAPPTSHFYPGNSLGVSIRNYSPAGRNLFIRLGTDPATITGGNCLRIEPNGYYETPLGYNGPIQGIWDGADAGGSALAEIYGYDPMQAW